MREGSYPDVPLVAVVQQNGKGADVGDNLLGLAVRHRRRNGVERVDARQLTHEGNLGTVTAHLGGADLEVTRVVEQGCHLNGAALKLEREDLAAVLADDQLVVVQKRQSVTTASVVVVGNLDAGDVGIEG